MFIHVFLIFISVFLFIGCSKPDIDFEEYNYETDEDAQLKVKNFEDMSLKANRNKLYLRKKIELENSATRELKKKKKRELLKKAEEKNNENEL